MGLRQNIMKKCLIAIMGIVAMTSCEAPKVRESFTHAKVSPDGKTGLFVFKREHYYPGTMGLLGPGRPDRYVVNQSIIGSYDMASGRVRVLNLMDNKTYINESRDFHILEIHGTRVLISGNDDKFYWLDTNSATLSVLPLKQELAERGRDFGQVNLVDEDGTLILVNKSLAEALNYSAPHEIWIRRPNGEYERVAELSAGGGGNYGFKDDELYIYSGAERSFLVYNIYSGLKRKSKTGETSHRNYNQVIDFHVAEHGSPQPSIARKIDGKWIYQETQINTAELR